MALAMATKRTVSVNSARTNVCNRRAVVAHGMVERVASVAVAGGLLFAASPAFALEAQGTQSAQYEQEMMSLISKRQGGKELNLEPKVAPAPPVAVDVLSAEAPLKVDATMSSEERTQIIRAAALKETVIKSAPATKWAPSKPAFSASRSAINTSGGSSNASAVVGLLALVAAAGGAAYYFQINNAPAGEQAGSSTTSGSAAAAGLEEATTKEGTPAPSSPL